MRGKKKHNCLLREDEAVSEVMGTLILITMAIVMFSALSLVILNPWANFFDETPPYVTLVASVHDKNVTVEHRGGVTLSKDTEITLTIGASSIPLFKADGNYIDSNGDGEWSIGERVVYLHSSVITGVDVKCIVVDVKSNTVVMDKIIES